MISFVRNFFAVSKIFSNDTCSLLLTNLVIFLCLILYLFLNLVIQLLLAEKVKPSVKNGNTMVIAHSCKVLIVT